MSTAEPAEPQRGTDAVLSGPNTASLGTTRYSVPQAARLLNISERAVRKRIEAGSLLAVRDGRSWVVIIEQPSGGTGSAPIPEPAVISTAPRGTDAVPAVLAEPSTAGVDIRPLVEHIAKLEDRIQSLTEAATVWQIRAVNLEEQLKQLTAGVAAPESQDNDDQSPETDEDALGATEPDTLSNESNEVASSERRGWFGRWLDAVMGR